MHLGCTKHMGGPMPYEIEFWLLAGGGATANGLHATQPYPGGGGGGYGNGAFTLAPGKALAVTVGAGGAPNANGNPSTLVGEGVNVTAQPGLKSGHSGMGYAPGANTPNYDGGGGGGGAAGPGANAVQQFCWGQGGAGGHGVSSDFSGVTTYYGGGGGGFSCASPEENCMTCASGGGSSNGNGMGAHGYGYGPNKGGGAGCTGPNQSLVAADSGVAMLRYRGPQRGTGGIVTSITVGGEPWTLHTFTSSGTFTA